MAECIGCGSLDVETLQDFGPLPPSNRFLPPGQTDGDAHRLAIAQCRACGLVQLEDPMPAEMVRARVDWLTYNEPEGHLDDLTSKLAALPGLSPAARVTGLTYKDDTTLARFNRLGWSNTLRLDPSADLGIGDPRAGLETVQANATAERCAAAAARHGPADLLLVRHVLEHAHAPRRFLEGLAALVRPGGYLVFEMPDCTKFIAACDYSFVWEEHIAYFSPATIRTFLSAGGFDSPEIVAYPYAFEDSLVAIARRPAVLHSAPAAPPRAADLEPGRRFGAAFDARRQACRAALSAAREGGKRIALFGAGHLAAKFVNVFGLGDMLDFVIDDHPHKRGLSMPGSGLPIVDSSALADGRVDLCLLSLSPESERKVLAKHAAFLERGGQFRSIFALSPMALVPAP